MAGARVFLYDYPTGLLSSVPVIGGETTELASIGFIPRHIAATSSRVYVSDLDHMLEMTP
jgi:hypothetical protein